MILITTKISRPTTARAGPYRFNSTGPTVLSTLRVLSPLSGWGGAE